MPVPSEDCLFFGKGNMTDASSGAGIAYPSDHLISLSVFSGGRVARSLVLCVCLSFCPFSFGHCVVCPSLIYGL